MKLQKVKIEKFGVIENFEAQIDGKNIFLVADNGYGKSSFMQLISIMLGDTKDLPPNFDAQAEMTIDKDGNKYEYKLKSKDGKPVVSVNGMKGVSKTYLQSISGAISFDPNKFVELSKTKAGQKEQVKQFKSFLPEEIRIDIEKYEQSIECNYNERTSCNANIKDLEGFINSHPLKGKDLNAFTFTDLKDVYDQLKRANEKNAGIEKVKSVIETRNKTISDNEKKIQYLLLQIEGLKKDSDANEESNDRDNQWLSEKENQPVDVSVFENKIESASEDNKNFDNAKILSEKIALFKKCSEESEALTKKIEMEREAVAEAIRSCNSPVDGLSFNEETLMFNGVAVDDRCLSTSEIMELGIRLKIAENPEAVLMIENSNLIGGKRWQTILDLAKNNNIQVLAEEVKRGQEELTVEFMTN